jgi:hypothetical protein
MALKKIYERVSRLQSLVESWSSTTNVSNIERDIVLEELRRLYDEVLNYTPTTTQSSEPESETMNEVAEDEQESEDVIEEESEQNDVLEVSVVEAEPTRKSVGVSFDDALDIAALLGLSGDDTIAEAERVVEENRERAAEIVAEQSPAEAKPETPVEVEESVAAVEETKEAVEETAAPAPAERTAGGGLFDIEDIPVRTKRGRKMISLYNEPKTEPVAKEAEMKREVVSPMPKPASAPAQTIVPAQPAPAPVPEPQRLADVMAKNVTTLADKMAEEVPTAAFNRITEIRKAIGINDKFLLIRDLFGGDANLYEDTITHLDEYDDLDECMIFIVENFRWDPDSEGAKLLVSLIERKLS